MVTLCFPGISFEKERGDFPTEISSIYTSAPNGEVLISIVPKPPTDVLGFIVRNFITYVLAF